MALNLQAHRWHQAVANTGAFFVPAIALCVPSGYSYGAVVLLIGAIFSFQVWRRNQLSKAAWYLIAVYLAMAFLWALDVSAKWGWGSFDRTSKYLLAIPCVFFLMTFRPRADWLWLGVASGAITSGLIALYQLNVLSISRPTGFTNAIQYGNLSLLMAAMSAAALFILWPTLKAWQRCVFLIAVLLGVVASVLSQSRGGWLALVLLLPLATWLSMRMLQRRWVVLFFVAISVALTFAAQTRFVSPHIDKALLEIKQFQQRGDGTSSVGQRLAHWRLAIEMGIERPLLGWGRAGYIDEKARRADLGLVHAYVKEFGHVHNEVLELFVKRGAFGVILLLAFYIVPLAIFWPTKKRILKVDGSLDRMSAALCFAGVLIPLCYAVFGLTQVFLAHNSGNMFYLFMCPLLLATLERHRAGLGKPS